MSTDAEKVEQACPNKNYCNRNKTEKLCTDSTISKKCISRVKKKSGYNSLPTTQDYGHTKWTKIDH